MNRFGIIATLIVVLLIVLGSGLFVVNQTEQALVLQFGKPVASVNEPGLKFKIPFMQNVVKYDDRLMEYNGEPMVAILKDKDRLVVDAFVRYRIIDPLKFYQTVRTEAVMNERLGKILEDALRKVLGKQDLDDLLSPQRGEVMHAIRSLVYIEATGRMPDRINKLLEAEIASDPKLQKETEQAQAVTEAERAAERDAEAAAALERQGGFGIDIIDVRIMRTDLPRETSNAIFERMRSERQKVAERYRAEGKQEAQKIRSQSDKEKTIILSEAKRKAEEIRGEGDGEATRIYAEAFGRDQEFFDFYRSMQAYEKSLGKDDTTAILSPDNAFLKYLQRR